MRAATFDAFEEAVAVLEIIAADPAQFFSRNDPALEKRIRAAAKEARKQFNILEGTEQSS